MSKSVVIMHFYNEHLLLPFWLEHHTKIFDEGVLINYASTDDSLDICKKLAPNWRIIESHNEFFGAKDCDVEVMAIEREYEGYWKVALNVTEFIVCNNFNSYVDAVEAHHPDAVGFRAHGVHMIDPPNMNNVPINRRQPLILQRHWGLDAPGHGRDRLIHKSSHGDYDTGRHNTFLKNILGYGNDVYVLWYGWSPWPQVATRKLQIKNKMPQSDIELGLGVEHLMALKDMEASWERVAPHTEDLLLDNDFAKVWRETMKTVGGYPILG